MNTLTLAAILLAVLLILWKIVKIKIKLLGLLTVFAAGVFIYIKLLNK